MNIEIVNSRFAQSDKGCEIQAAYNDATIKCWLGTSELHGFALNLIDVAESCLQKLSASGLEHALEKLGRAREAIEQPMTKPKRNGMTGLKLCPFCGNDPEVTQWTEIDRSLPEPNEFECVLIRCCTEFRSAEDWNTRESGD